MAITIRNKVLANLVTRKLPMVFCVCLSVSLLLLMLARRHPKTTHVPRFNLSGNPLQNIPKIIIQSVKAKNSDQYLDKTQDQVFRRSKASFAALQSTHEHVVMSDYEQNEWVQRNYPVIYPYYMKFSYDIHRSDFVRFLSIYHYGGYYFDSDVVLMRPMSEWYTYEDTAGKNISLLVGIEGDNYKHILALNMSNTWRPQQVTSWAFAATPRHPFFEFLVRLILSKKVAKMENYVADVAEFASPAVLTDALAAYLLLKGVRMSDLIDAGGNQMVEDVYLASIKAFGCGTMWSVGAIACDENDPEQKVRHLFAGSWFKYKDGKKIPN